MDTQLPTDLPSFDGDLILVDRSRVQALSKRLQENLMAAAVVTTEAAAFSGIEPTQAAAAACAACRGHCCRNGGNTAYLDEAELARVRRSLPNLTRDELVAAYVAAVPLEAYAGSCIFHAAHGCNLPREMRSQVCLTYFCWPLKDMLAAAARRG